MVNVLRCITKTTPMTPLPFLGFQSNPSQQPILDGKLDEDFSFMGSLFFQNLYSFVDHPLESEKPIHRSGRIDSRFLQNP